MSITVFLVDDHTILRDGMRVLLDGEHDIQVVGDAGDGYEAVAAVSKHCPDVVVIDIVMPRMDGIDAIRQIKKSCPLTQFIVLSMHATPEFIFQALRSGAQGYLLKESASDDLINAVRAVHAGRRYLSQSISDVVIDGYILQREATNADSPLASLSPREREMLPLVVSGKSNNEIADILSLSPDTVKTYRSRMMKKLGIDDMLGLVKFAVQHGLITLE